MIRSYDEYKYYLKCDKIALRKNRKRPKLLGDEIWKFQILLRKCEYYTNCSNNMFDKFRLIIHKLKFKKMSLKLGFSIPINVFGPGLSIAHYGTIVVNPNARIGSNCRIHIDVNIGSTNGNSEAAKIGNNVYIGPGVKIVGNISIPDGTVIGANAVVNKSINEIGITVAGVPAKKISENNSDIHLIKATELIK